MKLLVLLPVRPFSCVPIHTHTHARTRTHLERKNVSDCGVFLPSCSLLFLAGPSSRLHSGSGMEMSNCGPNEATAKGRKLQSILFGAQI